MKMKRRESREIAFTLIFEWGFREEEHLDEVIEQAGIGRDLQVDQFAHDLAQRTLQNCAELDQTIERYSQKWKLNRIPKVTLALLRMAFCELSLFPEIPAGATINEAVELAKKYATEDDAAYLNGILGQYERDRTGSEDTADGLQENQASVQDESVAPDQTQPPEEAADAAVSTDEMPE